MNNLGPAASEADRHRRAGESALRSAREATAPLPAEPGMGAADLHVRGHLGDPAAMRSRKARASIQIVDVRERDEFDGPLGRIRGAKLIPLGELPRASRRARARSSRRRRLPLGRALGAGVGAAAEGGLHRCRQPRRRHAALARRRAARRAGASRSASGMRRTPEASVIRRLRSFITRRIVAATYIVLTSFTDQRHSQRRGEHQAGGRSARIGEKFG